MNKRGLGKGLSALFGDIKKVDINSETLATKIFVYR